MHRRLVFQIVVPTLLIGCLCAFGLISYQTFQAYPETQASREAETSALVAQTHALLAAQDAAYQQQVATSLMLLKAEAAAIGAPRLWRTVQVGDARVPNLYFGLYRQGNRYAIVDYATQIHPGFAELYIYDDATFTSVSTTRTRPDGQRAIGQSFDWLSLSAEGSHTGITEVDGHVYYVTVEPMRDKNGTVIGRWVAGVPFDGWTTVQQQLAALTPRSGGFIRLVDDHGETRFESSMLPSTEASPTIQSSTFEPWGTEIIAGYTLPSLDATLQASIREHLFPIGSAALAIGSLLWLLLYTGIQRPITHFAKAMGHAAPNAPSLAIASKASRTQFANHITASLDRWQHQSATATQETQALQDALAKSEHTHQTLQSHLEDQEADRIHLHNALKRLATGHWDVQLSASTTDDFAPLFGSLRQAIQSHQNMQQDLTIALSSTHQTAADIASAADQLASASHEQSLQTEEVVAAVSQMTATIAENAASASQAATIARESGQEATSGGKIVAQTLAKIREIADVFTASSASIGQLHDSSQQISQIVALITDIAEQTNLLALNAAIEAARAGEHGKSFAVVAGEVRGLASRTREATTEIAQMIERIQHETTAAVQAMARGTSEVQAGLRLADTTGTALQQIVSRATDTENTVIQIAAANEEQSATSEEITRSVSAIADVTSGAASEVARIAEAATSLRALTEEIQELLHKPTATIHTLHPATRAA